MPFIRNRRLYYPAPEEPAKTGESKGGGQIPAAPPAPRSGTPK